MVLTFFLTLNQAFHLSLYLLSITFRISDVIDISADIQVSNHVSRKTFACEILVLFTQRRSAMAQACVYNI